MVKIWIQNRDCKRCIRINNSYEIVVNNNNCNKKISD